MNHAWCSDPARDEAVRAAEDAAASGRTPLPDHRDLPQAVHDLRRRVEQLEACACAGLMQGLGDEPAVIPKSVAEAEFRQSRARVGELESSLNTAPAANAGGEQQEPVAWGVRIDSGRGLYGHYDFESEARGVCDAVNAEEGWAMTVVPLYAAPVAESATTPQPPRGWLTEEERRLIERLKESSEAFPPSMKYIDEVTVRDALAIFDALLARSTPPKGVEVD